MKNAAPRILPVIHHVDAPLSVEQANLAFDLGADGIFLISHYDDDASLLPLAASIRAGRPSAWIGINFLSMTLREALNLIVRGNVRIDGLWSDRPGVSSGGYDTDTLHLATWRALLEDAGRPVPAIFGSIAFKYQPTELNPGLAASIALDLGFIPTTSGSATGHAPQISKIEGIREKIGSNAALACASGMTVENIASFAPHLSHVLVATGVSRDENHFDPQLLSSFIHEARRPQYERAIRAAAS